jgi:hypothetical protein
MMSRLRQRRVTAAEAAWRLRAFARAQRDRATAAIRPPRWRRDAIRRVLAPGMAAAVDEPTRRGDWQAVHATLAAHLRTRASRYVLDPATREDLRATILSRWPEAAREAAGAAGRLLDGRYDLLGYRDLAFGPSPERPDWHLDPVHGRTPPMRVWTDVPYLDPACGDHKIIWELNRHQHWLVLGRAGWLTGDRRFHRAIVRQLTHWLQVNPPRLGINWASMLEIGFRCLSWTWALHVLLAVMDEDRAEPWLVDLLVGLDHQLAHVERNLSYYFSPNTHLTGEALALYVVGRALPELAASTRWAATGRTILLAEIERQITADGGHAERSTHYHRYTLDFYLLALLMARRTGDHDAADAFGEAAARLATAMRALADDRGHVPLIGDDDGGMLWPFRGPQHADVRASLALAALALQRPDLAPWPVPEEVCWVAWSPTMADRIDAHAAGVAGLPPRGRPQLHVLPDMGYVTARDGAGGHLVFDAGPHGYLNGGHAHADALAITLTVAHRPLLIDPGTATYTMAPEVRDRMRRSSSHNTLTVDGRSTSEPAGPFHWASRADARLAGVADASGVGWMEGVCDTPAARHLRAVVATGEDWVIADLVDGTGRHDVDLHWHFAPAWHVTLAGDAAIRAVHADGAEAWLLQEGGRPQLVRGQGGADIGWYSSSYGRLEPTWSVRVSRQGHLPATLITWIRAGTFRQPPVLRHLHADGDDVTPCVALSLVTGDTESRLLLRPGDAPGRTGRTCTTGAYRTDGRLLHVRTARGRVLALTMADATEVLALEDGGVSVRAGNRVSGLHVTFDGDGMDVWASAAPDWLELRGAALDGVAHIRVNGHPVAAPRDRDGTLIVRSAGTVARPRTEPVHHRAYTETLP